MLFSSTVAKIIYDFLNILDCSYANLLYHLKVYQHSAIEYIVSIINGIEPPDN